MKVLPIKAEYEQKTTNQMEEPKLNSESLLDEAKKPFNKLMLVIAIVGLIIGILGIVLYFMGTKKRDISYELIEPTSLIFDSKNTTSNIKLLEKDSITITDNVYLLTGTLWNSGDLPITKEDIRKQLSFELSGAKRLLDFKIVKQKDETVAKFNLEKVNTNTLKINWEYFDPKYGFTFQLMYTGNSNPDFHVSGVVLGISKFNKIKAETIISYYLNITSYFIFIICCVTYIFIFFRYSSIIKRAPLPMIIISVSLVFATCMMIWDWYYKIHNPF